ncbi:DUF2059 domain-containing protein [Thalassovita taeanensis]|uniref:DUF2059 domain-containing protein n=1 Tax=Thalassovita taeanensis TaxID=657014 RepID=UPI001FE71255|nr:DUF2059 domain-containing protein [Thalassovita taeanensis]
MLTLMFVLICAAMPAHAQTQDAERIDALFQALGMKQVFVVMREEGLAYGEDLAADMLPGGSGPAWKGLVSRIYDPVKMEQVVRTAFESSFGATDTASLIAFFDSETGRRIVQLEIEARHTVLDKVVEEAARERFRSADVPYEPHLAAIAAYIGANDLVEYNVVGALNANYMFFRGLTQGGAMDMTEEDILRDVWAQEDETREDTREWLFAYLMLAYEPLSAAQIRSYAELSLTPEGKALNHALFAGFDRMYGDISLTLGLALAQQMEGEAL